MPAPRPLLRTAASDLPYVVPGVWHGDALGIGLRAAQPTGYGVLDAQLLGGGWPVGALSEVLQTLAGVHEWQLVLPALAGAMAGRAGVAVAVAPPCEPFGPALQARGLPAVRLCQVRADAATAALWAAEQALRCRDVLAVMAWLPQAPPAALRRLQLAAAQQGQLLWVFRPASAAPQASPAVLRLWMEGQEMHMAGNATAATPGMRVRILKRRGPPLQEALDLPACHALLAQALAAQAVRRQAAQGMGGGQGAAHRQEERTEALRGMDERTGEQVAPARLARRKEVRHALDRTAAALAE